MDRKLILPLVLLAITLFGCGEQADKKDFVDAPMDSSSQKDSMKERGMTDAQIAAQKQGPGGSPR